MKITTQIAQNLHQVYFGGNWTASNLKHALKDISIEMATQKVKNLNTILALSYHIHYYTKGAMAVLKGGDLTIKDKYSFNHPEPKTEADWQSFKQQLWDEAEEFIALVKKLEDDILNQYFADEKYGNYYRNLAGIIEHTHYHLGQILVVKKMIIEA